MTQFSDFGLHDSLSKTLAAMNFTTPTPIQEQAIPVALKGMDILGSAQTGTGKTGAYAIPMLNWLLTNPVGTALVLAPTRELAQQIAMTVKQMVGPKAHLGVSLLIGGESIVKQLIALRQQPRIIIGTPGRVTDHLTRKSLFLKETGILVLDETDRMLDMGFGPQLERIVKFLPARRQTMMFSATLPANIVKLSKEYLHEPVRIAVGDTNKVALNLTQDVMKLGEEKKYQALLDLLEDRKGSVIVFVKTKYGTEKLAKALGEDGMTAQAIHGDLRQSQRDRVIRAFREKQYRVLVATDVAARGLDIPHIEHVVNYHLPQVPEDYIHRIGRTARAGASGASVCFVSPQENRLWSAIERVLDPTLKQAPAYKKPVARSKSKPNITANKPTGPGGKGRKKHFVKSPGTAYSKPAGRASQSY